MLRAAILHCVMDNVIQNLLDASKGSPETSKPCDFETCRLLIDWRLQLPEHLRDGGTPPQFNQQRLRRILVGLAWV